MTPASATPRRRSNRNASAPVPLRGSAASARSLAAGLWRMKAAGGGAQTTQAVATKLQGRRRRGDKRQLAAGIGSHCQCTASSVNQMEASSAMEKATKWDADHHHPSPLMMLLLMEAELEKARCQISELEEERRATSKRLERFLRKLGEEKAAWKARIEDRARHAAAALREDLSSERAHRRQLEQANAKLVREAAEARSWGRQQAQSYEAERKAREVMEEACSELTREVEEDQAEVELLRRECLRMREEMEEERRMLQMAEVWREERVQMKLSDAKLALQAKYDHLAQLQAQMETCFLRTSTKDSVDLSTLRSRGGANSPASSNSDSNPNSLLQSVSPATDLFLAKVDDDGYANNGGSSDYACSWFGTSDRSASVANGNTGGLEARSSAGASNTALIRRLWRSAIAESRSKTAGGWSPSSSVTAPPPPQQSLRDKLMEARMMDDHKPARAHAAAKHKT